MRRYDRQRTDLSVDLKTDLPTIMEGNACTMKTLSQGGFSCSIANEMGQGAEVHIEIPAVSPAYKGMGRIVWCQEADDHFEVGVAFTDHEEAAKARMVEQVCQIERYKKKVFDREGRTLNAEQAALEWIEQNAGVVAGNK